MLFALSEKKALCPNTDFTLLIAIQALWGHTQQQLIKCTWAVSHAMVLSPASPSALIILPQQDRSMEIMLEFIVSEVQEHYVQIVLTLHYSTFLIISLAATCFTSETRLIGGQTEREGRLEVCSNGRWGTVCGGPWSSSHTKVACRHLGFNDRNGKYWNVYVDLHTPVLLKAEVQLMHIKVSMPMNVYYLGLLSNNTS